MENQQQPTSPAPEVNALDFKWAMEWVIKVSFSDHSPMIPAMLCHSKHSEPQCRAMAHFTLDVLNGLGNLPWEFVQALARCGRGEIQMKCGFMTADPPKTGEGN